MRTLFSCPELALQIEGFDTHSYQVDERVHVRHQNRLVSLTIESIVEQGDRREIGLRPIRIDEPLADTQPRTGSPSANAQSRRSSTSRNDSTWLEGFCAAIEGAKGPVLWDKPPRSH